MRCFALLLAGIAAPCYAQWTATILHPSGAVESVGRGAASGVQVGEYTSGGKHAALWTGSAGSLVDLHPSTPGAGASVIYASALTQQAGVVTYGFSDHAAIWSGTSASYIDMNPPSIGQSRIYGTDGGNQAGEIDVGVAHATFWSGTPASYVDLNPPAALASTARDVQGFNVTGYSNYGSALHASVWLTSLHLHTDLHPAGYDNSFGNAASTTQQGGDATIAGADHAALWSGTAASFVDLNPATYGGSRVLGMDDGIQCGWANKSGKTNAGVWFGSAASFVDLQTLLPIDYSNSEARAVYMDGTSIQVVGYAVHATPTGSRIEAILWSKPVPEPTSAISAIGLMLVIRRRRRPQISRVAATAIRGRA